MNKTDAELAEMFRTLVTVRLNDLPDDGDEVEALRESYGPLDYGDLTRMSGLGVAMTCNMLALFAESMATTPQLAWEFVCQHGRERGLPGMT